MATRIKQRPRRQGNFSVGRSLVLLLLGALLARTLLPTQAVEHGQQEALPTPQLEVPVLAQPAEAGALIAELEFESQRVSYRPGIVSDLAQLPQDGRLSRAVPAGQALTTDLIVSPVESANRLEHLIEPGKRAMTVQVDAMAAVEGWVDSGSFVDVLLIEDKSTIVVAENVRVLSAERSIVPQQQEVPRVPTTVTLLVTQDQCLAINTAVPRGRISFALRRPSDDGAWRSSVYRAEDLRRQDSSAQRQASIAGFASILEDGKRYSYALADGQWIKSEITPDGFFTHKKNLEQRKEAVPLKESVQPKETR
jgi:Flp pilus assembly protein CpaB